MDDPDSLEGQKTHGPKIHIWGGMSARGTLSLTIFQDNLNGQKYEKIIRSKQREMDAMYPHIKWPAYSPDLSPIENIWAWLKQKVNKDRPCTLDAVKRSVRKHWKSIKPDFLSNYIESKVN